MKALALLLLASPAFAGEVLKKDREHATASTNHPAPPVPGAKPRALINLYNEIGRAHV